MRDFAKSYAGNVLGCIEHYVGDRPLFDLYGVEQEIERALSRKVELKSGGYLIFDQTEALTTVDVNTGGFVGGRTLADTIFKTNLEAAQAIARQLRLRNLGGIIILDFIDMDEIDHRDAVLDELRKAAEKDRVRTSIHGFSGLGLVEMTRKRTRESLAHILCEPCACCGGRGELKTAQTVCYEILRELVRGPAVQCAGIPRAGLAEGDRLVPRRGVTELGAVVRLHRQAHFIAGGYPVRAGIV